MPDYTLLSLRCDACAREFPVYTELANHHLEAHELGFTARPAHRWMAEDRAAWTPPGRVSSVPLEVCPLAPSGPVTALGAFRWQCADAGVPCDEIDARLLLDTLGVPPDAPAAPYEAAIHEAGQRWKDRQGGTL